MIGFQSISTSYSYTGKGQLSIYGKNSFSRKAIILGVPIKNKLGNDGSFSMSLVGKDFYFESLEAKQVLWEEFGIRFGHFTGSDFFHGRFMDDLCFEEITDTISTYIIGGNLMSLNMVRKTSFIGNLKNIDGIVHFSSKFSLNNGQFCNAKTKEQKRYVGCNGIELEITSQLFESST